MSLRRLSWGMVSLCAAWLGCAEGDPGLENGPAGGEATLNADGNPAQVEGVPLLPGCGEMDAGVPEGGTVLVTRTTRFHTAVGVALRQETVAPESVELLIPDGVGFTRMTGTAVEGGGVRFTGVPSGAHYLRTGSLYLLGDATHVDLGVNRVGRSDAVYSAFSDSPAQVNLVNMEPWQDYRSINAPGTSVQLTSGDVDLYAPSDFGMDTPVAGQTFVLSRDGHIYSNTGYTLPVFDADKGDRLYVNQLNTLDAGTMPDGGPLAYTSVVSSVRMGTFSFAPDGTTPMPVTGVMQAVPQNDFSVEWRLPAFTQWTSAVNPQATASIPLLSVYPVAHGLQDGWVGYTGELMTLTMPRGASWDVARRLSYGNPYPSSWGVLGSATYSFRASTPVTTDSGLVYFPSGSLGVIDTLDNLIAGPVVPRISPPRELTIDGVNAYVPRAVGATSPVFAWQSPVMGTPTAYRASFYKLSGMDYPQVRLRIIVPGSATQFRVPPNTLEPGSTYYVRLIADGSPHYEPWRAPNTSGELLPIFTADTFSATFTTP
ncbi:fibronectin type III domain-containing protein [Myxococcaceae bacterium JPH2]|nr:fibronectin type III domain-containing protein [Myxococcaceae bacterium JPH2]